MTEALALVAEHDAIHVPLLGSIAIRVFVLPRKAKKGEAAKGSPAALPLDAEDGEFLDADEGSSPLSSYLEASRGKRCVVFLVNGQRQDSLDNAFIYQDLKFKYLRNRMMIAVDVDGLSMGALGKLMQGSRQGFYKGDEWDAILRRIIATLKGDPDLIRLEEEAEEQVSELEAGDEKIKQTLDQLIDNHHDAASRTSYGAGSLGDGDADDNIGLKTVTNAGVVSLLPPDEGQPAEYPVLSTQPANSSVRLRPDVQRQITIKSRPENAWPALSGIVIEPDSKVPELTATFVKHADYGELSLLFKEPKKFDSDQYPVRATLKATARFNGVKEPRLLELRVVVKPDREPSEPELLDEPTSLTISSREPVTVRMGDTDSHVRFRWDGKDELINATKAKWKLSAQVISPSGPQPAMNFSEAKAGRFSLLVSPRADWTVGSKLTFQVLATGPDGAAFTAQFQAEVAEPKEPPVKEEKAPRLVDAELKSGAIRRPPYDLKYIGQNNYAEFECWGSSSWTDNDPGCFREPTERAPLTLIINKDMTALRDYQSMITKKYTEKEVEQRVSKYTSHIAFHLYQMYQAAGKVENADDLNSAERQRGLEIQRVAMTLIKLMEIAR